METTEDYFELIVEDVPKTVRQQTGKYAKLVEQFIEADVQSMRLSTNKKPAAVLGGLRHIISAKYADTVRVTTKNGNIFLERKM